MDKKPLNRLYYFAAGAFLLALCKYFFVQEFMFMPKFFVVEFFSFGLFLAIVYLFDRYIRDTNQHKTRYAELEKSNEKKYTERIKELETEITTLKGLSDNALSSEDELKNLASKLVKGIEDNVDHKEWANQLLKNLANEYEIGLGICYFFDKPSSKFSVQATYGLDVNIQPESFIEGEGLNGQVAADKKCKLIEEVDEDYFNIESCSGSALPKYIYILPIIKDNKSIGLIEIATFGHVYINNHWDQLNYYIAEAISL